MEIHRTLTFVGVGLLLATFALNYNHDINGAPDEFNYAYITGIAMIIAFMLSFGIFNVGHWRKRKTR